MNHRADQVLTPVRDKQTVANRLMHNGNAGADMELPLRRHDIGPERRRR